MKNRVKLRGRKAFPVWTEMPQMGKPFSVSAERRRMDVRARLHAVRRVSDVLFNAVNSGSFWQCPEQKKESVASFTATAAADGVLEQEQLAEIRQLESRGPQVSRSARTAFHIPLNF
jgi:hypothetical protein